MDDGRNIPRRARPGPRGRVATEAALAEVRATVSGPMRRDLLIERLHDLQDRFGCLRAGHLVALAAIMRLAPVEVFEVASFYAHFDVLEDDAPAPPPVTAAGVREPVLHDERRVPPCSTPCAPRRPPAAAW